MGLDYKNTDEEIRNWYAAAKKAGCEKETRIAVKLTEECFKKSIEEIKTKVIEEAKASGEDLNIEYITAVVFIQLSSNFLYNSNIPKKSKLTTLEKLKSNIENE